MSFQGINKILLVGNLGHEPELRRTPKNNFVLSLSIATNREINHAEGDQRSETHWHRATVWGDRAVAAAKILRKGSRVFVEGQLHMKSWTDKDGQPRKSAEIFVDSFQLLNPGKAGPDTGIGEAASSMPELALVH